MAQDQVDGTASGVEAAQPTDLFQRIQTENNGKNSDHFAATDTDKDGALSRDEVAAGARNPALSPAQREWMELMDANYAIVSRLSNPGKTSGITKDDETTARDLFIIRENVDVGLPDTVKFVRENFSRFDADSDEVITLNDVFKIEEADKALKEKEPAGGLSEVDLAATANLKLLLVIGQVSRDAEHYFGGSTARFSAGDLEKLSRSDIRDLAGRAYMRERLIGPYGEPGWKDYSLGAVGGLIGYAVGGLDGVLPGFSGGMKAAKSFNDSTKNYFAARDGIRTYDHYKQMGLDTFLDQLTVVSGRAANLSEGR
jgi:Ca2+-binding EF-hand superfamily protein